MSITLLASFIGLVLVLFLSTFRSWYLPHLFLVLLQVNNKIFFYKATCEDIIPSSYTLCANWVLKKYCHSDRYSNQVKMFCRKSCGVCNDNQVGKETVNSKILCAYCREIHRHPNLQKLISGRCRAEPPPSNTCTQLRATLLRRLHWLNWTDSFGLREKK